MSKLTEKQREVLAYLDRLGGAVSAMNVGYGLRIGTQSPTETAARHLINLTKAGFAEKHGTRMFPKWAITPAGRSALAPPQNTGERE